MLIKRYILIFTLALISCAGTNYIHSMTASDQLEEFESNTDTAVDELSLRVLSS